MSVEVLRSLLSNRLGLELEQASPEFLPAFQAAAARQGLAVEELARRADADQWKDWISRLMVPETHFFRHQPQLDRLRRAILPEFDGVRPVRLWSAGCCTGEEAYTLALLAHHRGWTDFNVLATDVDEASLAKARAGIYGGNSFREGGGKEFLQPRPDGRYEVRPEIRRHVTFERANVLGPSRPGHHVILCRNVLIYLTPKARQQVTDSLAGSLALGGVLLVSPCEGATLDHPLLVREVSPEGLVFRRADAYAQRLPAPPRRTVPSPLPGRPTRRPPPPPRQPDLSDARRLADRGRYREAEELCRQALALPGDPLPAHFLLAQLAELQGDTPACRQRLELILSLDPQSAGAWLLLAELGRVEGDAARTQRLEAAAREALRNLPAERRVEPYGRPAGQLLAELE